MQLPFSVPLRLCVRLPLPQAKHHVTLMGGPEDGRKIHVRDRVKKLWSLVNPPVIYVVKTPCMGQCSWAEYARRAQSTLFSRAW